MEKKILWSGSITLPAPTQMKIDDEIIWSSNTGRSASGVMIGDVIAQKKNVSITWGILTETELALIKKVMIAGFFPISFRDDGIDMTISSYRGIYRRWNILLPQRICKHDSKIGGKQNETDKQADD